MLDCKGAEGLAMRALRNITMYTLDLSGWSREGVKQRHGLAFCLEDGKEDGKLLRTDHNKARARGKGGSLDKVGFSSVMV